MSEHICQISFFLNPMSLKSEAVVFTMTQLSTYSGASEAIFGVTTLPATEKTRSLLLLATGIAKTTNSTNSVGQCLREHLG